MPDIAAGQEVPRAADMGRNLLLACRQLGETTASGRNPQVNVHGGGHDRRMRRMMQQLVGQGRGCMWICGRTWLRGIARKIMPARAAQQLALAWAARVLNCGGACPGCNDRNPSACASSGLAQNPLRISQPGARATATRLPENAPWAGAQARTYHRASKRKRTRCRPWGRAACRPGPT